MSSISIEFVFDGIPFKAVLSADIPTDDLYFEGLSLVDYIEEVSLK